MFTASSSRYQSPHEVTFSMSTIIAPQNNYLFSFTATDKKIILLLISNNKLCIKKLLL